MSWTLITCESARSYSTEMEIFPPSRTCKEKWYSLLEGAYFFQCGLKPNKPGLNHKHGRKKEMLSKAAFHLNVNLWKGHNKNTKKEM